MAHAMVSATPGHSDCVLAGLASAGGQIYTNWSTAKGLAGGLGACAFGVIT